MKLLITKTLGTILILFVVALLFPLFSAHAYTDQASCEAEKYAALGASGGYAPNQIIVGFKPGITLAQATAVIQSYGFTVGDSANFSALHFLSANQVPLAQEITYSCRFEIEYPTEVSYAEVNKINSIQNAPDMGGEVVLTTGPSPSTFAGLWVKWSSWHNDGAGMQEFIRYVQVDGNGRFKFDSWANVSQSRRDGEYNRMIDTNGDGTLDSRQSNTNIQGHYGCESNPHTFTVVKPVGWTGNFSSTTVTINNGVPNLNLQITYNPSTPPTPTSPPPPTTYCVEGYVYIDANQNGNYTGNNIHYGEPNDDGQPGQTVYVRRNSDGSEVTHGDTDNDGRYVICGIPAGGDSVMYSPAPGSNLSSNPPSSYGIPYTFGPNVRIDFALIDNTPPTVPPTATPTTIPPTVTPTPNTIYGRVVADENGDCNADASDTVLTGKPIDLYQNGSYRGQAGTDGNGYAIMNNLPADNYQMRYTAEPGWQLCNGIGSFDILLPRDNYNVYVFVIKKPPTPTITPNPPSVSCNGNTPTMSPFTFYSAGATWYIVYEYNYANNTSTPVQSASSATTTYSRTFSNTEAGQARAYIVRAFYDVVNGPTVYSEKISDPIYIPNCLDTITGTIFLDNNRNSVWDSGEIPYPSGATVTIPGVGTAGSNGSGVYTFSGLLDGTYTLTTTEPGYLITTPPTTLTINQRTTTQNFGITNVLQIQTACNSSYTNNGRTAPAVFRPSTATWYLSDAGTATTYLQAGDNPVPGDYDGDGRTDIAIYRPSTGNWTINGVGTFNWNAGQGFTVPADYDGDGKSDIAIWYPFTGEWFIKTTPPQTISWGGGSGYENDLPVPADYDGDGKTDVAIYRPSTGDWYIKYTTTGATIHYSTYGGPAYTPVPGDYDGDGYVEPALYNLTNGQWSLAGSPTIQYGAIGYTPVPGDYDGDGDTDVAIWNSTNGQWAVSGMGMILAYGGGSDIPVACSNPTNSYHISGNVSLDYDNNNSSDAPSIGTKVTLTGGGIIPRDKNTDNSGNYTFVNVRPRGITNYTVTLTNPNVKYTIKPSAAQSIPVGPNQNSVNFQITPKYQISGVIFDDLNKDKLYVSESPISQNFRVHIINSLSVDTTITATNGVFSSGAIFPEGTYRVRIETAQKPAGYIMTYPTGNTGDPYFDVTIGRSCNPNGNLNATCVSAGFPFTASDIQNVAFGMTDDTPITQIVCGDWRRDGGISEHIASTMGTSCVANPQPAISITGPEGALVCTQPGVIFSGSSTPYYGDDGGKASAPPYDWQVGNSGYPESYAVKIRRTSYTYMQTTLRKSSITPLDLSQNNRCGAGGLSNCTLNTNLPSGIYIANSNLTLNAFTISPKKGYIFLVNGDLRINGEITTPLGASDTFSVSGNIYVNQNIGVSNVCSQTCNVTGWFSSDHSFTAEGINSCATGADKRLNICGGIVTNAGGTGGGFVNNRDLCANDRIAPSVAIIFRPDMILNAPEFLKFKSDIWQEVAP